MKNRIYFILTLLAIGLFTASLRAQATPTTNVHPSAALEIDTTSKGFLPPRMTEAQRNAIASPTAGLIIYNLSDSKINYYDGSAWVPLSTTIVPSSDTVLSSTGKTWMSKNLGANNIATASNDVGSYGGLFQWGRTNDGHQWRTSGSAAGPVAAGTEGSNFITVSSGDWLSTPDNSRWNGSSKGTHDPCPSGFRVPTETEWNAEAALFSPQNAAGALASVLKLPMAGDRNNSTASISSPGNFGFLWSSTVDGSNARRIYFYSSTLAFASVNRSLGVSVRCIQE